MADLGTTRVFGDLIVTGNLLSKGDFISDGSNIININANNITSGTLNSNRLSGNYNINAATATKLNTTRTINGTSFDGTGNITTTNWGAARNITIGNTTKSVNGSANVSWNLDEIGSDKTIKWTARVRAKTWSQVARIRSTKSLIHMCMFSFAHTRQGVVTGGRFIIGGGHSNAGSITQLYAHNYHNLNTTIRLVNIDQDIYAIEIFEDTNNPTTGQEFAVSCELTSIFEDLQEMLVYENFTASVGTPRVSCKLEPTTLKHNNNSVYHTGFKPTTVDIGAVNRAGDTMTGKLTIHHPVDSNGWPNATNNNANNYVNRSRFTINAHNNGLHFIANGAENTRVFGIQSGHAASNFTSSVGRLHLNPFGGEVRCGSGVLINAGSILLSQNFAPTSTVAQIRHDIAGTDKINFLSRMWRESASSTIVWEKFSDATIRYSTGASGANTATLLFDVGNGNITATGNITGFSDIRVKNNIERIPDSLNKVKQLSGYTFDRTDMERSRQTGVIAQEVQKVLPEAVETQEGGMLSVAYGNMVGLLIEAIKELNEKVERLEKENNKSLVDKFKDLKIFK